MVYNVKKNKNIKFWGVKMKKVISLLNIVLLIILMFTSCSQNAENRVISIENPPFTEEITLNEGQEKQGYFIVFSTGDFKLDDIVFKNKNEKVASLSFLKFEKLHYVFYTVEALAEGETYIWFETKDAAISSDMIRISVGKNSLPTPESTTEIENTTEPESTTQAENDTEATESAVGTSSYSGSTTENMADHSENVVNTTGKSDSTFESTKPSEESTTKEAVTQATEAQTNTNSKTVYITPTGKRYHFKASCAGKNAIETTLENAKDTKTPCKKCAGG